MDDFPLLYILHNPDRHHNLENYEFQGYGGESARQHAIKWINQAYIKDSKYEIRVYKSRAFVCNCPDCPCDHSHLVKTGDPIEILKYGAKE